ncbi:MAG: L-glyceraldehyde 3-phosphate reductase [Candidatus Ordinivivax streblomastigis]|uniref:L-glyceraldehyde 3-phosphate reductase n=1 Tax=Candidatus Ordinivivax streblomastigis TaxID=2540710 RepID=A0A5M8P4V5_9BACT|nr:MAG: L-glyceraldehyde 3-phosphate reductase [Candidatus Ordinivivax streblomastigis]
MNRRKFLGFSVLATAGAIVNPPTAFASVQRTKEKEFIPTRVLGKTGLTIPILSMGVMRADNPSVVRAAYKAGLTFFDTAHGYQNGKNEEMLGAFFKDKDRNSFFIATKGKANPDSEHFETEYEELLNTSLRRLQMDYVDIFYAHAIDNIEQVNHPKLTTLLKKFKEEGKIKHIGFSTHANKPEQIDAAIEAGIYEVILISYNFKLNILPELDQAIQRGVDAGIGFVAMKTMVGGTTDAEGEQKIDGAACLRWVWKNPNITTAIPGFTGFDLLDNCLEAAYFPQLNDKDKLYLAGLQENEMLYCQNCEKCVDDCQKHLTVIPSIMRAYMYNYGYRQPSLSKETLAELQLTGSECSDCKACSVRCPSGFNVAEKIASISPIIHVPDAYLV